MGTGTESGIVCGFVEPWWLLSRMVGWEPFRVWFICGAPIATP